MTSRVEVLGVPVDPLTMAQTVETARRLARSGASHQHVALNAAKLVSARRDPALAAALRNCSLVSADGAAIVWASRLLGRPLPERVTGIDLMERLVAAAAADGHAVFLLGARPDVLGRTVAVLRARHPGLWIAGCHHGYWTDDAELVRRVRAAGPRYLFLAIPSPRKEIWLHRHLDQLQVPFAMGVGGAFDIIASARSRAPWWMQRAGLEWVFRLVQEPRRLGRRYLVGNLRFFVLLVRELIMRGIAAR